MWCYKLGVDNFDKLVMVMKNYSSDARQIVCERDSIHDFFKEEGNIIKDNDMTLDVVGYFNVDELE